MSSTFSKHDLVTCIHILINLSGFIFCSVEVLQHLQCVSHYQVIVKGFTGSQQLWRRNLLCMVVLLAHQRLSVTKWANVHCSSHPVHLSSHWVTYELICYLISGVLTTVCSVMGDWLLIVLLYHMGSCRYLLLKIVSIFIFTAFFISVLLSGINHFVKWVNVYCVAIDGHL